MTRKILAAATAALLLSPAAHAKGGTAPPFRFATLESDYQWDNDLDKARGVVVQAVPLGLPFWEALDIFKQAGARCVGDKHDAQIARCVYSDWITVHDYYRADLSWTAVLRLGDGEVATLSLDREVREK